jgi:hypothetical protein
MEPLTGDHPLGLASPLNYAAFESGKNKIPSKRDGAWMQVTARGLTERNGEVFFLDILFNRISVMETLFTNWHPHAVRRSR